MHRRAGADCGSQRGAGGRGRLLTQAPAGGVCWWIFRGVLRTAVLIGALSHSQHARAQAQSDHPSAQEIKQAQSRWKEGKAAFDGGDMETALLAFRQAYTVLRLPAFLQNLGETEWRMGRNVEAARHLAEFLRLSPGAQPVQREAARRSLARAAARLATIIVETSISSAEVKIDAELAGKGPLSGEPWYVEPGRHTVVLHREGYADETVTIDVQMGRQQHVSLPMRKEPSAPAPSAPAPSARAPSSPAAVTSSPGVSASAGALSPPTSGSGSADKLLSSSVPSTDANTGAGAVGYLVGGLGILALVGGAVTRVLAFEQKKTVDADCPGNECGQAGWDALSTGRTLQTTSTVLLAAGAVGLGAGAYLLLARPSHNATAASGAANGTVWATVGGRMLPSGAAIVLGGGF